MGEIIGARIPKYLTIKGAITINGQDYFGRVTPYAMRLDKNGYPHFLIYLDDTWLWKSAKHFRAQ